MSLDENQLVDLLSPHLDESGHLTFRELTLTNNLLDMANLSDSNVQKRIDLAGLNKYDGQILFFEAEREFSVKHPLTYLPFADFCYLLAPASAYRELPEPIREEQITWATKKGLGIVLVEPDGRIHVIVSAKRNVQFPAEIRTAVRAIMRAKDPLSAMYPEIPHFAR
ncbi:MAG: hypothetical protein ACXACI_13425 [Candidatus Hodarchaeales archaeon]|jgi:hypothetical protein